MIKGFCLFVVLAGLILSVERPASAEIVVNIGKPCAATEPPCLGDSSGIGRLILKTMDISVSVTSTFEIKSVHAQVNALGVDLSVNPPSGWTGTLDMTTVPWGLTTLAVTATDVMNNSGVATRQIMRDDPPLVNITSPEDGAVVRSDVLLRATCADDDLTTGCVNLRVMTALRSPPVATGTSAIDQSVSLADFKGRAVTLYFGADDSGFVSAYNPRAGGMRTVFVEDSPNLMELSTLPGQVLDAVGARVLYSRADHAMMLRDAGIDDVQIGTMFGNRVMAALDWPDGRLTSAGVAWNSDDISPGCPGVGANEWRRGMRTTFSCEHAIFNGDYAYFSQYDPVSGISDRQLRNLATGAQQTLVNRNPAGDLLPVSDGKVALGSNGDVVSASVVANGDCIIHRVRAGALTTLATVPARMGDCAQSVRTDGVNVAYTTIVGGDLNTSGSTQLRLIDPHGEHLLLAQDLNFSIGPEVALSGGWVAYVKPSPTLISQVWVRSPDGVSTQLSFFGSESSVEAVNSAGEVMFRNGARRYFASATSMPIDVSSLYGRAVPRCDGWLVLMGNTVFRVTGIGPNSLKTGCPDDPSPPPPGASRSSSSSGCSISRDDSCGHTFESLFLASLLVSLTLERRRAARATSKPRGPASPDVHYGA